MKVMMLLVFLPLFAISQSSDTLFKVPMNTDGNVEYSKIIFTDSTFGKDFLFGKTTQWLVKYFNSSTDKIALQDRETGNIYAHCSLIKIEENVLTNDKITTRFNIDITVKDGRLRLVMNDFLVEDEGLAKHDLRDFYTSKGKKWKVKYRNRILQIVDNQAKEMILDLEQYLAKIKRDDF